MGSRVIPSRSATIASCPPTIPEGGLMVVGPEAQAAEVAHARHDDAARGAHDGLHAGVKLNQTGRLAATCPSITRASLAIASRSASSGSFPVTSMGSQRIA